MSTTPPPDRPTEPLPPARPAHAARAAAPAVDPNVVFLRLEDAIASLRTGLMIVGAIAVAALGVAIYALLSEDGGSGAASRSGLASDARLSQLEERVDRLSRQLQDARSGGGDDGNAALADRVAALERTVKTLAGRPAADPQQAIDQLSGRIDDLAGEVEALKQQQPAP